MHQFLNIDIISFFRCLHLQLALSLKSEIYFLDLLHTNKHQCQLFRPSYIRFVLFLKPLISYFTILKAFYWLLYSNNDP